MFNKKRNKVIKIIKGQSNENYLTEISHTFLTWSSPSSRDVMPFAPERTPLPRIPLGAPSVRIRLTMLLVYITAVKFSAPPMKTQKW